MSFEGLAPQGICQITSLLSVKELDNNRIGMDVITTFIPFHSYEEVHDFVDLFHPTDVTPVASCLMKGADLLPSFLDLCVLFLMSIKIRKTFVSRLG